MAVLGALLLAQSAPADINVKTGVFYWYATDLKYDEGLELRIERSMKMNIAIEPKLRHF